jgi:hypothetical protein
MLPFCPADAEPATLARTIAASASTASTAAVARFLLTMMSLLSTLITPVLEAHARVTPYPCRMG